MLAPAIPAPTMTTRACFGTNVLVSCAGFGERGAEEAIEVRPRVALEIEIELRGARLEEAPEALAHVRGEAHQAESTVIVGARLAEIDREHRPLARLVEVVVH